MCNEIFDGLPGGLEGNFLILLEGIIYKPFSKLDFGDKFRFYNVFKLLNLYGESIEVLALFYI